MELCGLVLAMVVSAAAGVEVFSGDSYPNFTDLDCGFRRLMLDQAKAKQPWRDHRSVSTTPHLHNVALMLQSYQGNFRLFGTG